MTVKELIEKLQEFDDDVIVVTFDDYAFEPINDIEYLRLRKRELKDIPYFGTYEKSNTGEVEAIILSRY